MRKQLYDDGAVTVFKDGTKFYIRYDAGSHQIVIREDEISESEALEAMKGAPQVDRVLFTVQERILASGCDPYTSNV